MRLTRQEGSGGRMALEVERVLRTPQLQPVYALHYSLSRVCVAAGNTITVWPNGGDEGAPLTWQAHSHNISCLDVDLLRRVRTACVELMEPKLELQYFNFSAPDNGTLFILLSMFIAFGYVLAASALDAMVVETPSENLLQCAAASRIQTAHLRRALARWHPRKIIVMGHPINVHGLCRQLKMGFAFGDAAKTTNSNDANLHAYTKCTLT
ncbi:hypothetical protein H257_19307 [Aphanomyces astaci]|uniref:Uncharacterized protein n=1 Tax=Aphanomyces astaci TaxID=112090 RepID=W4FAC6_APHAT|nr:hypothetical protein H257_19307 [Aphanomyces astaci]ETV63761.1 hypothetical protein H257_19307 [Aphanomyces astaci]|eukprot:XP_009846754.1 hypothetical protein H257_19307 [Aphanomyces astaci]